MQKGFALPLLLIGILLLVGVGGGAYYLGTQRSTVTSHPQQKACTQEAKQCPDGSYVSRTGPNCEFAECPNDLINWRSYTNLENTFSINYPGTWLLRGGVFDDENKNKIAEFAPGVLTTKNKFTCDEYFQKVLFGGSTIEAEETSVSFSEAGIIKKIEQEKNNINGADWSLLVTEMKYEGGPDKGGIWYPHMYCYNVGNRLFLINFYERSLPAKNIKLYKQILSTFKFLK